MSMNQIPLQDKEKVINDLAQGHSYSQAMQGTAIKSKDTIHRIAHQETNAIVRRRAQYLRKIKQMGASDVKRAQMWSNMIFATKKVSKDGISVPDWQARALALKYIDTMAGLNRESEIKLDVKTQTIEPSPDLNSPEVIDWNENFRKFLENN